MNKYLCLDVGNVLGRLNMMPFVETLSTITGHSHEKCFRFLAHIQKSQDLGIYSIADELHSRMNIIKDDDMENLLSSWNKILIPCDKTLSFYDSMIKENNQTAVIVSNVGLEHSQHFETMFGKYDFFKDSIKFFSCDVGARKPTPIYYHMLLQMHPEVKGAVYVDDLEENLKTGHQMGFKTFRLNLSEHDPESLSLHFTLKDLKNTVVNG